jgi:outer membrane protein assembly factor BamE (lipoprotein component of BamABCDE complex)
MADYRSIGKGMTEEQVVALLGTPDRIDKAGTLHWWQDRSPNTSSTDYVELDVNFDVEGRVVETAVRSGDEHYSDSVRDRDAPLDPRGIGTYTVFRP